MNEIPIGSRGTFELVVGPDHLANRFKDASLPAVLATPVMILVMENAALNVERASEHPLAAAIIAAAEQRGVEIPKATNVNITPGHGVSGIVDGRRIEFTVRAFDGTELIGAGTHQRALIELAKFAERLRAKTGAG